MSNCEKIVELNIHGYPKTPGFKNYEEWIVYATKKLSLINGRMTIKDFLSRDKFLKTSRDSNPEKTLVQNIVDNPAGPFVGPDFLGQMSINRPHVSTDYVGRNIQRREFGFREKILQGYPNYSPDRIGWGDTSSKVIAGFVTVGDGIFNGIPPHHDISLDKRETRRQSEYGYGRITGKQMIPSGLCFIQDETSGIGIHVGSDMRFLWNPKMYSNLLANASVTIDQMHTGATLIPKADYRQFLRVGDFVVVEVGIRLNYWNSLLGGNELYKWETLFGFGELYDRRPVTTLTDRYTRKTATIPTETLSKVDSSYRYTPQKDWTGQDVDKKSLTSTPRSYTETNDRPAEEGIRNVIDHPWSTGTPIPVNSGMPFVMTEEFVVDSTDRKLPYPKEISASDIRDLKGVGTNKGSSLKGQLVSVKNLRIIIPTEKRWRLVPELAVDSAGKRLEPGIYSSSIQLTGPVLSRNETPPINQEYDWPIPAPEHLFFNDESHEKWTKDGVNMMLEFPDWLVGRYFSETEFGDRDQFGNPTTRPGLSSNAFMDNYRRNSSFKFPKHIAGDHRYWKHNYHNFFGVDNNGIKVEIFSYTRRSGPAGFGSGSKRYSNDSLPIGLEWSTPPQNEAEMKELGLIGGVFHPRLIGATKDYGWAIMEDESNPILDKPFYAPNGARYSYRTDDKSGNITYNLGQTYSQGDVIGIIPGLGTTGADRSDFLDINEFELDKIVENSWPDKLLDYSRMGMPYYKYEKTLTQPFPITIDKKDGGYWFTNPEINLKGNRKIKDLSRYDPKHFYQFQAHSSFFNKYESWYGEYAYLGGAKDRHPIDHVYSYYEDMVKAGKVDPSKVEFLPNKVYYAADPNGIVIPIRINANTELARFRVPVPTGLFDITGIAWQYSTGEPGLEWEREGYMMQIWPRFLSDVKTYVSKTVREDTVVKPPVKPPTPPPTPPVRLPDLTLDMGDAGNPARLDCDRVKQFLNVKNKEREDFEKFMSWPVNRKQNELDPNSNNIHKDPVSGREISLPSDQNVLRQQLQSMPIYPCKGMKVGDQRYVTITSQQFPGVSRTFFFTVGPNGECLCTLIQPGNSVPPIQNTGFEQSNTQFDGVLQTRNTIG